MAYYSNKFFERGSFSCDNLKITLISSSVTILPGLSKQLINISQERLKSLGITIVTNTKLIKVEDGFFHFQMEQKQITLS